MKLYLLLVAFTAVTAINCSQGTISVSINPGLTFVPAANVLDIVIAASSCKSDTDESVDELRIIASANRFGSCVSALGALKGNSIFTITTKDGSKSAGDGTLNPALDTFTLSGRFTSGAFSRNTLDITGKGTGDIQSITATCSLRGMNSLKYNIESLSIKS